MATVVEEIRDEPLAEAVRRLAAGLQPERIYLFGSRARGDWNEDSDYDLLIIVPGSGPSSRRVIGDAYRVVRDVHIPMDLLVWTREAFERQVPVVASLPATVIREGRLVYAA